MRSILLISVLVALSAIFHTSTAKSISISGIILNQDSTPMPGVKLLIKSSGNITSVFSDSSGKWSYSNAATSIYRKESYEYNHIPNWSKQLIPNFQNHDIRGRSISSKNINHPLVASLSAGRIQNVPNIDTIEYSYSGKIFLRDTFSENDSTLGIRIYDTTWNSLLIYGYITDPRNKMVYRIIQIGSQTWMAQNLKYKSISDTSWCYGNSTENCNATGRLYKWNAAVDVKGYGAVDTINRQGACPVGWHLPNASEWRQLVSSINAVDSIAYRAMKSPYYWGKDNASDSSGFRIIPSGQRDIQLGLGFDGLGGTSFFWTSSDAGGGYGYFWPFYSDNYNYLAGTGYNLRASDKSYGYSVRCLKN